MAKGTRSARGVIVDFDLLRIKEQIGSAPKGTTVQAREDFIDNKFKRRLRRLGETVAVQTAKSVAAVPVPALVNVEQVVEDVDAADVPTKKKIAKP